MHTAKIDALEQMLSLGPVFTNLCKPLFVASPIAICGYSEYHRDGSVFRVTSDKKWFEKFLDASLPAMGNGTWLNMSEFTFRYQRAGFSLWDLQDSSSIKSDSGVVSLALESAGLGHVCSYVEKPNDAFVRVHQFIGRLEDSTINDFHLNNTNMLKYFARYVANELQPHIRKTRLFNVFQKQREAYDGWMSSLAPSRKISIPRFLLEYAPHESLSKRQKDLIYWTIKGKTREEIAIILDLKVGTVKKYFERLQHKFKCGSKNEIIAELLKIGFCFEDLKQ